MAQNYIPKNRSLLIRVIILCGILGALLFGVWGFQHGWQRYYIEGHAGDMLPGEYGAFDALRFGFLGCLVGIIIVPMTIITRKIISHYLNIWTNHRHS